MGELQGRPHWLLSVDESGVWLMSPQWSVTWSFPFGWHPLSVRSQPRRWWGWVDVHRRHKLPRSGSRAEPGPGANAEGVES